MTTASAVAVTMRALKQTRQLWWIIRPGSGGPATTLSPALPCPVPVVHHICSGCDGESIGSCGSAGDFVLCGCSCMPIGVEDT